MTQVPPGSALAVKVSAGSRSARRRRSAGPRRLIYADGGRVPRGSPAEGASAAAGPRDAQGRGPDKSFYGDNRDDRHIQGQNHIDHLVSRARGAVEAKRAGGGKFPAGSRFSQRDLDEYKAFGLGDPEKDYGSGGMVPRRKYEGGGMVDRWGQNTRKYPPMGTGPRQPETPSNATRVTEDALLEHHSEKMPVKRLIKATKPREDETTRRQKLNSKPAAPRG